MKRVAAVLLLAALAACHRGPTPSPSLALLPASDFFAAAEQVRGSWRIELHLGGPKEVRSYEVTAEGAAVPVSRTKMGPVATWTVPPARFLNGQPFLVTLKTEGGRVPLRLEVPGVKPGQTLVGLNLVVVK